MSLLSLPFSVGSVKQYVNRWLGLKPLTGAGSDNASRPLNADTALQISAAWACAKLVSESIATMPLFLYKKRGGKRTIADGHSVNYAIHVQPNADATPTQMWQSVVFAMLLRGRAHAEKVRGVLGNVVGLNFLNEDWLSRVSDGPGRFHYRYFDPETSTHRNIAPEDLWYIPNLTIDGKHGVSPIAIGAASFTGVIQANQASESIWRKGLRLAGVVNVDRTLTDDQREKLRGHVTTVTREGSFLIMEKGQGFSGTTMTPNDAELLASRRYGVEEVCRWFGVPPFMIGHAAAGQTNWGSGIEQQMIGFVTFVLRPICIRIEQAIKKDLLTDAEKSIYSAEFSMEGLLRGDSAARSAFYQVMVRNGIYTRDEVRILENLEPHGGNAEVLTVESSLIPLDKLGEAQPESDQMQEALKNWLLPKKIDDNAASK